MVSLKQRYYPLFRQFLPMSTSDMVMALGDPIIVFVLASLPNGTQYLAAFALGKGVAVFFESPIISILPTSNAMACQFQARQLLFRFVLLLGGSLSIAMLLMSSLPNLPNLFGMSESLWQPASLLILLLCPWPLTIALRRFWQGQIIRAGFPTIIAKGSLLRCIILTVMAFVLASLTTRGEWVAAGALLLGVLGELWFIRYHIKRIDLNEAKPEYPLPTCLPEMGRYYWPLAQSMVSLWGARLVLPFLIATTGELQIAGWAAGWALVISISNGVRMVQQLVIRNAHQVQIATLKRFSISVGCIFSLVLLSLATTPWGQAFSTYYAGGDNNLGGAITQVIIASSLLPILMAIQNYLQGLLMVCSATTAIGRSSLIANAIMVIGAVILVQQNYPPHWIALMVVLATAFEVCLLAWHLKNSVEQSPKELSLLYEDK